MQFIKNLKWRYATKKFDSNKHISNTDLEYIKEAIQLPLTAFSYIRF